MTSRFIVARSIVPAVYLYHILNLDIVHQRIHTLVFDSSSTEVKFDQLVEILVRLPEDDDFDLWLERVNTLTVEIDESRSTLESKEQELQAIHNELYQ